MVWLDMTYVLGGLLFVGLVGVAVRKETTALLGALCVVVYSVGWYLPSPTTLLVGLIVWGGLVLVLKAASLIHI